MLEIASRIQLGAIFEKQTRIYDTMVSTGLSSEFTNLLHAGSHLVL